MSAQPNEKNDNYHNDLNSSESFNKRVNVNDLVSKMNEDKKRDRKNSIILGLSLIHI